MRKIKAKKILAAALAVFVVSAAAGCASTPASSGAAGSSSGQGTGKSGESGTGGNVITMWGWNAGDIEKIFAAYKEKTGSDAELDYVTVQQAEAFQKLQTTVSAGLELPDIVPSEIGQRGTMMALDIWEDLGKPPYGFDKSMIFDYFIPLCTNEKGELVCLPWDVSTAALAYKKKLAKDYLGTDDPAELERTLPTWDEFQKVGADVYKKSNGSVFMFASLTNVKQIMDGQNPTPIVENNKLDMEKSVKVTLKRMIDFRDNDLVDNIIESSPAYSASYADDIHIFYPCASWSPNYQITPNDPKGKDRWGLMVPPGGCYSWGGSGFMIPRDAKNKQEGFKLVNWFLTKEGTVAQYDTVGYFIGNKEAYEDPDFAQMKAEPFGDQNLGEVLFVKAMKNINVRPVSVYDVAITDTWNLVTEAVNSDHSIGFEAAAKMFETELRNKAPELK